jgi:hypothetical protein
MPRRRRTPAPVAALALAAAAAAAALPARAGAQAPARPAAAVALPGTAAGAALGAWLDAFNSADPARLAAYARQYQPDRSVAADRRFREQTGGFDLLSVEHSDARRVEFTLRERGGPTTAYGVLELADAAPARVAAFAVRALPPGASAAAVRIDAATRRQAVEAAAAKLDSFYVFPDVARRMGDTLRARLARGAYDGYGSGVAFALRLDHDLRRVARDKHLRVDFALQPPPPPPPPGAPAADVLVRGPGGPAAAPAAGGPGVPGGPGGAPDCAFRRAEILEGNVGYVKFDMFAPPSMCAAAASAAMNAVAGARALVVDLRENGGGDPAMVAYVSSYLFDRRTHLNDLWTRRTNATEEFWTRDSVPGPRLGGSKPVYVLTSASTFSGAEEFAYNLKSLKRATLVGETTGGGAHPVSGTASPGGSCSACRSRGPSTR